MSAPPGSGCLLLPHSGAWPALPPATPPAQETVCSALCVHHRCWHWRRSEPYLSFARCACGAKLRSGLRPRAQSPKLYRFALQRPGATLRERDVAVCCRSAGSLVIGLGPPASRIFVQLEQSLTWRCSAATSASSDKIATCSSECSACSTPHSSPGHACSAAQLSHSARDSSWGRSSLSEGLSAARHLQCCNGCCRVQAGTSAHLQASEGALQLCALCSLHCQLCLALGLRHSCAETVLCAACCFQQRSVSGPGLHQTLVAT